MNNLPNKPPPHNSRMSKYGEWHKQRHVMLHNRLLELVNDFINITKKQPDRVTVQELLTWSADETKNPSHENGGNHERPI